MLDHLLHDPDALAFALLVVFLGATLGVGLAAGHRRDRLGGGPAAGDELLSTWPHLLRRELVAALATLLAVTWWAILRPVPLGVPADPSVTPALAKAPWFFVGVQEMLQYFDPWLAGAVLPLLMLVGLCALPYLDASPEASGRHTLRERPVALVVILALLVIWLAPMAVGLLLRGEHFRFGPVWQPAPLQPDLPPAVLPSLAARLGLGGIGAQLLGAGLCLGPFIVLALLWRPLSRRTAWAARMGRGRFLWAGFFVMTALGVFVKVLLHGLADVRYLWITPWFRI